MNEGKVIAFKSQIDWAKWLEKNFELEEGIFMRIYKKDSGIESITYAQALDEALCYGWIDGIKKKYDDKSFIQKFTPRRKKSIWSKINIGHVKRLESEGKIKPSGYKQIELAKQDGRWEAAYDSPSEMTMPEDFLKELSKNKKAEEFFKTLNKTNLYAIAWRLQTAKKPETRTKRIGQILEMLSKREKFH